MGLYLPVKQLEEEMGGPRGLLVIFMSGQVDIILAEDFAENKTSVSTTLTLLRSNLNEIFKLMGVSNLRKHFRINGGLHKIV